MSRQDKTTEATLRMLHAPAPSIAPASESPPMAALPRPRTDRRHVSPHDGLSAACLEREVPRDRIFREAQGKRP